jgi:NADH:ubiquinone oxidoreductase subunit F (NADH-binding)
MGRFKDESEMTEFKERLVLTALSACIVGTFVLAGLSIFAGNVFADHAEMKEQIKQLQQSVKIEMQLLQMKQMETNARVIEMRRVSR